MEKLKDMKIKHDHTLTDIVKVVVFWLFLIMPILVWMPTALYYGFNEHADNGTQTATATAEVEYQYKYQTNEVSNFNDIKVDKVYHADNLDITDDIFVNQNTLIKIYRFQDFTFDTNIGQYLDNYYFDNYSNENNYILITLLANTNDYNVKFTNTNAFSSYTMSSRDVYLSITDCDFSLSGGFNQYLDILYNTFGYDITNYSSSTFNVIEGATANATIEYNNDNSIVNAMSNAWQQTWQTPVLSWTGNQNFNFTIQAFTNIFGITEQSYITNYLTYILTMTAIYIIFDIVLGVFKLITHIVNEK